MLLVCSSRSQKLPLNIVWGQGGSEGQAKRAKVDHSDEIGGQKGECVNNFVADCSLQVRLIRGFFSNADDIYVFLMIFAGKNVHCKLVSA